jgi:hypothetical protein
MAIRHGHGTCGNTKGGIRSRAEDFPDGFFHPYARITDFRQFRPL